MFGIYQVYKHKHKLEYHNGVYKYTGMYNGEDTGKDSGSYNYQMWYNQDMNYWVVGLHPSKKDYFMYAVSNGNGYPIGLKPWFYKNKKGVWTKSDNISVRPL